MNNVDDEFSEIQKKITMGTRLAFKRLVEKKRKENSYLILSVDGKPTKVMAKDINLDSYSDLDEYESGKQNIL
jgi:ribosomal protein L25 (general stress protein Ctc)